MLLVYSLTFRAPSQILLTDALLRLLDSWARTCLRAASLIGVLMEPCSNMAARSALIELARFGSGHWRFESSRARASEVNVVAKPHRYWPIQRPVVERVPRPQVVDWPALAVGLGVVSAVAHGWRPTHHLGWLSSSSHSHTSSRQYLSRPGYWASVSSRTE